MAVSGNLTSTIVSGNNLMEHVKERFLEIQLSEQHALGLTLIFAEFLEKNKIK